jgi:hypothetical protein
LLADGQATERLPRKGKVSRKEKRMMGRGKRAYAVVAVTAFSIMGFFGTARLSEPEEP